MEKAFNYQDLPYDFAHCLNSGCVRADQCLRRKMALLLPNERETVMIVNHQRFSPTGEDCSFFKKDEKRVFAKGFSTMLNLLPQEKAIQIRKLLTAHFGKSLYYRFYRKECLISPEQQAFFKQAFLSQNIQEPPVFDEQIERYE